MRDDLIDRLVAEADPVRPATGARFVRLFGLAALISLVIVAVIGIRADLRPALTGGLLAAKLLLTGTLACPAIWLLWLSGRPGARVRRGSRLLIPLALAMLTAPLLVAFVRGPGSALEDMARFDWASACLPLIALATLPLWIASLAWLRVSAPTNPARSAWIAGLASASMGAFLFALHCPFDSLAYVATWYFAAIFALAGLSRLVIPPLIRW
ncbi:hypothetical protein B5C34_12610 [Pacificimonas flava]|uniref:Extracytoplasmic function alternative sigma factor n=2 Tax=Pacificimonas TaxID=1960290 RepID=A0A219B7X3_9SPHN|nr:MULTISPECIES: DUF1109 domain-containing protein [Pacificimonas]MBZ6378492.1 DUF1109 domain-containing protein [Pacificimonas aurantium]OWV34216.1 hypothetical protein B5C34_12610 [Pacificimonas flava]